MIKNILTIYQTRKLKSINIPRMTQKVAVWKIWKTANQKKIQSQLKVEESTAEDSAEMSQKTNKTEKRGIFIIYHHNLTMKFIMNHFIFLFLLSINLELSMQQHHLSNPFSIIGNQSILIQTLSDLNNLINQITIICHKIRNHKISKFEFKSIQDVNL